MYRGRLYMGAVCVLALALGMASGGASGSVSTTRHDPDDATGPLDLRRIGMGQSAARMKLEVRTGGRWALASLDDRPNFAADAPQSYLCLDLRREHQLRRACLGARNGERRLVLYRVAADGGLTNRERVSEARIRRPDERTVEVTVPFRALRLEVGGFRFRWLSGWSEGACASADPGPLPLPLPLTKRDARRVTERGTAAECADAEPNSGFARGRVRQPRIVGCTRDEHWLRTHGSRERKRAALTFDDGPSTFTDDVLGILNRYDVKGTFFEIGDLVPGHGGLMSRMLRKRHEIGNHSLHHELYPGYSSIATTSRRIDDAVGFWPCTFRPPYGGLNSNTARSAWRLGMSNIIWDVDPRDWSRPGSGAIYSRVVSATRPGSIVLMHDGGGDRSQTVAALPGIVRTLKGRGYELVTVSSLLGERKIWWP